MQTKDVERTDVPNAQCCECGKPLNEAAGFASYSNGKYKCDVCWAKNAEYNTKCEVWSRTVGYLAPLERWNDGKQTEFRDRKTYTNLADKV